MSDLPSGLVLLYHRLGRPRHDPWNLFIAPELFAEQMRVLADHWPVLSLSEGLGRLDRQVLGHWVAVSFDDGYAEVAEQAVPRLQVNQCLTLFVCTDDPEQEFWWDRLDTPEEQSRLRNSSRPRVEAPNTGASPRLLPEQLAELARHHEIASHTHQHLSLPRLSVEEQQQELLEARRLLEEWTGQPVTGLAYPFGDWDARLAQVASSCCHWACTTRPGLIWRGTPRWQLPRYWAPALKGKEFHQWLCGQGLVSSFPA